MFSLGRFVNLLGTGWVQDGWRLDFIFDLSLALALWVIHRRVEMVFFVGD